ncbi:hypothetical protein [Acidovorax sp.]|uniref:hypothetical protein n=1 Tax=Acidovorax sp. TaxID=1872122 RepID=UPI002589EDB1|nr:hypothetical protein [Acidovorax sp.]
MDMFDPERFNLDLAYPYRQKYDNFIGGKWVVPAIAHAAQADHLYPARPAFDGYKKSGIGRENRKQALSNYQPTKNLPVSHKPRALASSKPSATRPQPVAEGRVFLGRAWGDDCSPASRSPQ